MRGSDISEHAFQVCKAVRLAKREGYSIEQAREKYPILAAYECLESIWPLVDNPLKNRNRR